MGPGEEEEEERQQQRQVPHVPSMQEMALTRVSGDRTGGAVRDCRAPRGKSMHKDFVALAPFTPQEIRDLLDLARLDHAGRNQRCGLAHFSEHAQARFQFLRPPWQQMIS